MNRNIVRISLKRCFLCSITNTLRKYLLYFFVFLLITSCSSISKKSKRTECIDWKTQLKKIADELSDKAHEYQPVAILDFTDINGTKTNFGKLIAEDLITCFYKAEIIIIERNLLSEIIDEHKLNLSGFIDETTVSQIGKISGVKAIITGTITRLHKSYEVNARLISTETGTILASSSKKL